MTFSQLPLFFQHIDFAGVQRGGLHSKLRWIREGGQVRTEPGRTDIAGEEAGKVTPWLSGVPASPGHLLNVQQLRPWSQNLQFTELPR